VGITEHVILTVFFMCSYFENSPARGRVPLGDRIFILRGTDRVAWETHV